MTHCTRSTIRFSRRKGRKVEASFQCKGTWDMDYSSAVSGE